MTMWNESLANNSNIDLINLRLRLYIWLFNNPNSITDKVFRRFPELDRKRIEDKLYNVLYGRATVSIWFAMILGEALNVNYWLFMPNSQGTGHSEHEKIFGEVEARIQELGVSGKICSQLQAVRLCNGSGILLESIEADALLVVVRDRKIYLEDVITTAIQKKAIAS